MQITELIGHPELLSSATLPELRRVVGQCPYYQAARLLLLENLFMLHEPDFDKELRAAALCVPDRSVIFNLVESLNYQIDVVPQNKEEETFEPTGDRANDLIDNYLREVGHTSMKPQHGMVDPVADYIAMLEQMDDAPGAEGAEDNWPLDFTPQHVEKKSAEVTRVPEQEGNETVLDPRVSDDEATEPAQEAFKPAQETVKPAQETVKPAQETFKPAQEAGETDDLTSETAEILSETEQNFAGTNPDDEEKFQDESVADNNGANALHEEYFTETLAKVFIKQGNYQRAIEILTKINLVNPRKNAYFADQIRFLQKLVVNNKHKK